MNEMTKATRIGRIIDSYLLHMRKGDPLAFKKVFLTDTGHSIDEYWVVRFKVQRGSEPYVSFETCFYSEEEAKSHIAANPIGSTFDYKKLDLLQKMFDGKPVDQVIFELASQDVLGLLSAVGDVPFLVYEVLSDAQVVDQDRAYGPSIEVIDFVGADRIEALKEAHGENWSVVAELMYCAAKFPDTSPAYVAALFHYHYYISQDNLSAGYLLRDLEIVASGIEGLVAQAMAFHEGKRGASKAGGAATQDKAMQRIKAFTSIALASVDQWIAESEKRQASILRGFAIAHDEKMGSDIFSHAGKPLSGSWFRNALSDLRASGALRKRMQDH